MNHNTPVSPRPLSHLSDARQSVQSTAQLRARGVSAAQTAGQCRPGGPWQQILPGVYVLHPGPPTSEERLHAALLYAGRPIGSGGAGGPLVPAQVRAGKAEAGSYGDVVITGLAALALHRFSSAPALLSLDRIDVLVPRTRRLRSTGCAQLIRVHAMPPAQHIDGLPVAPAARALADAVAQLTDADADAVRRLLTEAVLGGHCEPAAVVRELTLARLLSRPHVVDAVDSLLAEGRAIAEDRLYAMVRDHGLPDPLWNVDLRLPGGPHLGSVDIYWPDQAVAVELDTRAPRQDEDAMGSALLERSRELGMGSPLLERSPGLGMGSPLLERSRELGEWSEYARKREHLERLGITVVHITPKKLREAVEQQATVVRTALMASSDREPPAYVVVLPR